MLIHGGINTETRKVLGDFSLFDIGLGEWIECEVSEDPALENPPPLQVRQMHTMEAIFRTASESSQIEELGERALWT